jgi:hypothetical protein
LKSRRHRSRKAFLVEQRLVDETDGERGAAADLDRIVDVPYNAAV